MYQKCVPEVCVYKCANGHILNVTVHVKWCHKLAKQLVFSDLWYLFVWAVVNGQLKSAFVTSPRVWILTFSACSQCIRFSAAHFSTGVVGVSAGLAKAFLMVALEGVPHKTLCSHLKYAAGMPAPNKGLVPSTAGH